MSSYEVKNLKLKEWVRETAEMCKPDRVHWCDGGKQEYDQLIAQMVAGGAGVALKKRPNSYLFSSDPSDVARTEERTYIATATEDEAFTPRIPARTSREFATW